MLNRKTLIVPLALAVAIAAWLTASDRPEAQSPAEPPAPRSSQADAAGNAVPAGAQDRSSAANALAIAPASTATKDEAARWIAEAASDDPRTRAAAIAALARAPKALAVPALHRVLEAGHYANEQQIALSSLHTIAIDQGDTDGRVRDAIRGAIYHGSDESVSENAQALLEDIEAAMAAAGSVEAGHL